MTWSGGFSETQDAHTSLKVPWILNPSHVFAEDGADR